jgi:hypothetical protein
MRGRNIHTKRVRAMYCRIMQIRAGHAVTRHLKASKCKESNENAYMGMLL